MKEVIVTTSWDDGHILDLKLAELLKKYGLKGTFYIAPRNREFQPEELLNAQQTLALSREFEIGSHTMTHPVLTALPPDAVTEELRSSKNFLANLIGREVSSFCYPRGAYNEQIATLVERAGYMYARTTKRFATDYAPSSRFEAMTSMETHRSPIPSFSIDITRIARLNDFNPVQTLRCLDWEVLARRMFDKVLAEGGVFHLWGHSWVVDRSNDWGRLERVFAYIGNHNQAVYLTNGELADMSRI